MTYVVTSGSGHIDIDALACAEAYNEFLLGSGQRSQVVFTPQVNATVPPMIRQLQGARIRGSDWVPTEAHLKFVVMDVSNPDYFDPIVKASGIAEIFDHHYGHEEYWLAEKSVKATIEPIGACATLVWERIREQNGESHLSEAAIQMLMAAILSNSLNFKSQGSTIRDEQAYAALAARIGAGHEWKERFFTEVGQHIAADPVKALLQDQKIVKLGSSDFWMGQIELWDAQALTSPEFGQMIMHMLSNVGPGLANIVSIEKGVNYIYADSVQTMAFIRDLLPGKQLGACLYQTSRLWLRKEIIKEAAQRLDKHDADHHSARAS